MTMLDLQMNALDAARGVAGLGVNWFIQSSLLIVAGLWIGAALRSKGSAAQSAVYRTTLAAVLACPLVSWALAQLGATGWSLEMPAAYVQESAIAPPQPVIDVETPAILPNNVVSNQTEPTIIEESAFSARFDAAHLDDARANLPADELTSPAVTEQATSEIAPESVTPTFFLDTNWFGIVATAIGVTWILLGGFLLARLVRSWRQLIRIRSTASSADAATVDTCRNVAELFRVAPPTVLHSPFLPSPCLAGLRRPAVLLPDAELKLPMRDVLIHELAHLARGDCYWNLLRRIGTALLFFQPLMWRLSRRLDSTAEEVCDDYVVQFGGDRREYAHRLVDIAELSVAPIAAAGVGIVSLRSMLAVRVARIMDTSRSLSTRVGHVLLAIVLICGLLGTMLAGLVGVGPGNETVAADTTIPTDEIATESTPADEAAPVVEHEVELQTVRGRAVDSEGKPIAGAHVRATQTRWVDMASQEFDHRQVNETRSLEDGSFEISVPKVGYPDLAKNRLSNQDWQPAVISAVAAGYAPAWMGGSWQPVVEDPLDGEVTLQLRKMSPAIRGRLVNLEGQPLAGLHVQVKTLTSAESGKVDEWLATVERLRVDGKLPRAGGNNTYLFAMSMVGDIKDLMQDRQKAYFPQKWRLIRGNPAIPAAVVRTDADGRFEIAGLPPDCLAELEISGPGVATHSANVVTRKMARIDIPLGTGGPGFYGLEFDHPVAPGTEIVGNVTDAESGKPVAGVTISAMAIVNQTGWNEANWVSTTDVDGRFRIEGLPADSEQRLRVVPPLDEPYIPIEGVQVTSSGGERRADIEIKLRRGVLVQGKVLDAETGNPVDATIHYHPFLSNEFARLYETYSSQFTSAEFSSTRYRTKDDGSFEAVVIPGRGVLAAQTIVRGDYCAGLGAEKLETDPAGRLLAYNYAMPSLYQRVLEIDVPADANIVQHDLTVSQGVHVTLATTDPKGEPLTGVQASGASPVGGLPNEESKQASIELKALRPGERRQVTLLHQQRRLGRMIEVVAPTTFDHRAEPRTVTLEPCATVTGRVVDGDGEPISGAILAAYALPMGAPAPEQTATDANGNFRFAHLPIGTAYRIVGHGSQEVRTFELVKELEFEPGETIDVGTIDVTKRERPEPKRTKAQASATTASGADDAADVITVRGRVLDAAGKPIGGAEAFSTRSRWLDSNYGATHHERLNATTTDANGEFQLPLQIEPAERLSKNSRLSRDELDTINIVATAPGFATAWERSDNGPLDREIRLQLPADDAPIRGRLVDLQGQPVGGVRVAVKSLWHPRANSVDQWLNDVAALHSEGLLPLAGDKTIYAYYDNDKLQKARFPREHELIEGHAALPQPVTTDADGRFEIPRLGRDRLAVLEITGEGIVKHQISVVTRDMERVDARQYSYPGYRSHVHYGREFDHVIEPGQTVLGRLVDQETREPIAGVTVDVEQAPGFARGTEGMYVARTDSEGQFRIDGLPVGEGSKLKIIPGDDQPYLMTSDVAIPAGDRLKPVEFTTALRRGIVLHGRVIDSETVAPVDATVHYHPFLSNEYARNYSRFNPSKRYADYEGQRYRTRPDGSFQIAVIPGQGILGVQTFDDENYCLGSGAEQINALPDEEGRFPTYDYCMSRKYQSLVEVNLPADVMGPTGIADDVKVVRGRAATLQFSGPNGQPLTGVRVANRTPRASQFERALETSRVDILGLATDESRQVGLWHEEQQLGAVIDVEAAPQPRAVQLEPCAVITGRLVNEAAEPLANIQLHAAIHPDGDYSIDIEEMYTDSDGRFTLTLPPNGTYRLGAYIEEYGWPSLAEELALSPGERIELSTIDVSKKDRPQPQRSMARTASTGANNRSTARQSDVDTKSDSPGDSNTDETMTVRGRVVGPDGESIAGATVIADWLFVGGRWPRPRSDPSQDFEHAVVAQTKSDATGHFELTFSKTSPRQGSLSHGWHIAAYANGYGPAWKRDVHLLKDSSHTLQLTRDLPVRGRILDLEGKPIAGINVRLRELRPPTSEQAVLDWVNEAREKAPPSNVTEYFTYYGDTGTKYANAFPTAGDDGGLAGGSPALPAETKTDRDGRFTFSNLGENRLAMIEVDGSTVAKSYLAVVTRDMEAVSARPLNMIGVRADTHYGREFEFVSEPTQPIVGTVTDADTGQPLENIEVRLGQFAGNTFSQGDFLATRTDKQGKYELIGAPQGGGHRIGFEPPVDQHFFPTPKTLPATPGNFDPIVCDMALKRGQWIVGKLTDAATHEPIVDATVHYLPLRTNGHVPKYSNYDPRITGAAPRDHYRTAKDGSYRVLAIPGAGILAAIAQNDDRHVYSTLSENEIPKHLVIENGYVNTYHPWISTGYHALREVEILEGVEEFPCSLQFQRGLTRRFSFVDTDGMPVQGARVLGRVFPEYNLEQPLEGSTVDVIGLRLNVERVFAVLHPERRIGKASLISTGEATSLQLEPCAIAQGRVLDEDGQPVSGIEVGVSIDRDDNFGRSLLGDTTNADGRFEVLLPPGMKYRVGHYSPNGIDLSAECMANASVVFALGDLVDGTRLSAEQTAKMVKAATTTTERNAGLTTSNSSKLVRGRVLDQEGKPIAKATVRLPDDVSAAEQSTKTDAAGNFQIEFDKTKFTKPDWHQQPWQRARLIAAADGFAPAWVEGIKLASDKDFTITLKPDNVPVRGQILTLEGQPVPNARLEIWDVYEPTSGNLAGLLKTIRDDPNMFQSYMNREMEYLSGGLLEPQVSQGTLSRAESGNPIITTNEQGQFEFRGIGPERMMRLSLKGSTIQSTQINVVTRPEIDAQWERKSIDEQSRMMLDAGSALPQLHAATFTHFAGPSAPIRGVVRDKETGKPLSGIPVGGWLRNTDNHAYATTDEDGRYELTGLGVEGTFQQLYAGPKESEIEKLPYLGAEKNGVSFSLSSPLSAEDTTFELSRGIVVRGTVTDAATGEPVKARVEYMGTDENPFISTLADDLWPYGDPITNDQGEFAIVVPPGPGALAVWTTLTSDLPDRYRPADPKTFGLSIDGRGWISTSNRGLVHPWSYKAAKYIDFKAGDEPAAMKLIVEQIMDFARVRCVDENGRTHDNIRVAGHLPWSGSFAAIAPRSDLETGDSDNAYVEVAELGAKSRKPVIFLAPERDQAAILFPSNSKLKPRLSDLKTADDGVHLLPLAQAATVTGRLIDADGNPVRSARIELILVPDADVHTTAMDIEDTATDDKGRFELRGLPAGGPYLLAGGSQSAGGILRQELQLTAGQRLDLGDIDLSQAVQPVETQAKSGAAGVESESTNTP